MFGHPLSCWCHHSWIVHICCSRITFWLVAVFAMAVVVICWNGNNLKICHNYVQQSQSLVAVFISNNFNLWYWIHLCSVFCALPMALLGNLSFHSDSFTQLLLCTLFVFVRAVLCCCFALVLVRNGAPGVETFPHYWCTRPLCSNPASLIGKALAVIPDCLSIQVFVKATLSYMKEFLCRKHSCICSVVLFTLLHYPVWTLVSM